MFLDVLFVVTNIPSYLLKGMPHELCGLFLKVQAEFQEVMCCKRETFRRTIFLWWLPAAEIRLENMNEVNVHNHVFIWKGFIEFQGLLEQFADGAEVHGQKYVQLGGELQHFNVGWNLQQDSRTKKCIEIEDTSTKDKDNNNQRGVEIDHRVDIDHK